jgi:hypothetical protein
MTMRTKTVTLAICAGLLAGCGQKVATPSPGVPEARPAFPAWATPLVGKKFKDLHLTSITCTGATDVITVRYVGAPSGYQIAGWGWNDAANKPLDRIVLVAGGVVVGAGEGGLPRPDVPKAIPKVTSQMVGWKAVTNEFSGRLEAFGVSASDACRVGKIRR